MRKKMSSGSEGANPHSAELMPNSITHIM